METERYISGYCRQLDASRMVEVIMEDGKIIEVDCCYENCPHTGNCLIAKSIQELAEV